MRAGSLNETVSFYREETVKNETGEQCKDWIKFHEIKACKRSIKAVIGDGVSANEEFIGNTIVLQVRAYSFIKNNMRIEYQNIMYDIVLLDKRIQDNSYLITCKKNV